MAIDQKIIEKKNPPKPYSIWYFIVLILAAICGFLLVATVFENQSSPTPPDDPFFVVKKPAIYLYPEHDSQIRVQLEVNGEILNSIPDYGNGWEVIANRGGMIDGKFDYLFYETRQNHLEVPNEGWVVKFADLREWMDAKLPELGFNEKEKMQFKEYWLNELPDANYYRIGLLDENYLEGNMAMKISPKPDVVIRRIFYFKPLSKQIKLAGPIISVPDRKGFVVFEWGGLIQNSK